MDKVMPINEEKLAEKPAGVTIGQVIGEVRRLAKEAPDNKYERVDGVDIDGNVYNKACFYDKGDCSDGTVGCIFGQAFTRLGLSVKGNMHIRSLLFSIGIESNSEEQVWCGHVQVTQDKGSTWREAVDSADELAALLQVGVD